MRIFIDKEACEFMFVIALFVIAYEGTSSLMLFFVFVIAYDDNSSLMLDFFIVGDIFWFCYSDVGGSILRDSSIFD